MKLAVSILKSKFNELETIEKINKTKADYIHVDVMDGKFVKEVSKKYEYLYKSKKKLKVHLMVSDPFNYISQYSLLNTETIILSSEIDENLFELIEYIHSRGLKAGLAIKPGTSVKKLNPYLKDLEEVLILTVEPGKGGQKMRESVLYKLDILNRIRKEKKYHFKITIDGGVNDETVKKIQTADIVVSGSFICNSEDFNKQIEKLSL